MSSMSDLVFLLLIFFMITSTLVSPNVISLSLPKSEAGQQNVPTNVEVYIDSAKYFYVVDSHGEKRGPVQVSDSITPLLFSAIDEDQSGQHAIILRSDKSVPIQSVVDVMDVISRINDTLDAQMRPTYKVALATQTGN